MFSFLKSVGLKGICYVHCAGKISGYRICLLPRVLDTKLNLEIYSQSFINKHERRKTDLFIFPYRIKPLASNTSCEETFSI